MIQSNEPEEKPVDRNKTFYSNDLLKAFYIVLKELGGMAATRQLLDQVPKDYLDRIVYGYNEKMKALTISIKPERTRKIIKPGSRIITPG